MLVIPGGGHRLLCVDHEGVNVARWLADRGITAFMLKHRLARETGSTYTIEGEALADTQRALRLIRTRAAEWNVDPARLGAIGFSAGGELVALSAMRPGDGKTDAADPIDRANARPAFQALIYPGRSGDIQPAKDSPPLFSFVEKRIARTIAEGLALTCICASNARVSRRNSCVCGSRARVWFARGNEGTCRWLAGAIRGVARRTRFLAAKSGQTALMRRAPPPCRTGVPHKRPAITHIATTSTAILQIEQQARGVFDALLHAHEKRDCFLAINDAVVVAQREIHHRANDNLPILDDRTLLNFVHAEDA